MANITELVFILDKSGSMSGLESDTIGGFNSMIEKQRAEEGTVFVSTILFNNQSQVLHDRIPLEDVKPLTSDDYFVGGTTALLDAVGDAIKHIRNVHKYAREEDRPQKTLFVITTDGYENASCKFNYGKIKQLIERQKELGWDFVFLGANIDAAEVADSIGIERRRAVNYHADSRGTERLFFSVGNFVSASRKSAPSESADDSWREDLDEDFKSR
ncbi:MAG: VWA domain-containing protein [Selenomonadaceae bacterium]|nr:VWA domain-containing protein [Selenomonadaceae bacterium]MBR4382971.1 VWA domain-containing protein [Selenomonadaceae bacterium]